MNESSRFHIVFGSGGSKAILGGSGAILAFEVAGMRDWLSIGSCSGGSLPAIYLASGKPTKDVLRAVVDTDFSQLLKPKRSLLWRLAALLFKYRYETTRPQGGVYSALPMGDFVRASIGAWPANFWTVSSGRKADYVFTRESVYMERSGFARQIDLRPLPLCRAIMATCAVPGFIDGVRFANDVLHDGALSVYGECPAAVPVRFFGALPQQVIAFDMVPEPIKQRRWLKFAWKTACMGQCGPFDANHLKGDEGYVLIRPNITGFHGLQFDLPRALKWQAVCTGFDTTVKTLLSHGLVQEPQRARLTELAAQLNALRSGNERDFSSNVERLLIKLGLLAPARIQK